MLRCNWCILQPQLAGTLIENCLTVVDDRENQIKINKTVVGYFDMLVPVLNSILFMFLSYFLYILLLGFVIVLIYML